jgi:hypothetical protein
MSQSSTSSSSLSHPTNVTGSTQSAIEGGVSSDWNADVSSDLNTSASSNGRSKVREGLISFAEQQKTYGLRSVGSAAQAAQEAADRLRDESPSLANLIRSAATKVEQASKDLEGRSVQDMVASVNSLARAEPVVFFGGSVFAGFVLSRLLKSGTRDFGDSSSNSHPREFGHG